MPKIDMPKVDMPKVSGTAAPSFSAPKFDAPKFDVPKVSGVSLPKLDVRTDAADEDVEPQEIRDDRAKAARATYNEADSKAKVRYEMQKKKLSGESE